MKIYPMPSGLSKKKSAPALLLHSSSPSNFGDNSQSMWNQSACLGGSRSAPFLTTITRGDLPDQEMSRKNNELEETIQKALTCVGLGNMSVDSCITDDLAVNFSKKTPSIRSNDSQQQIFGIPSSYLTSGEPLRSLRNFSNQPTSSSSISSSTGLLLPSAAKTPLVLALEDDSKLKTRSSPVSKRISARCLQAFRKLRPHSVFSPDHHLNTYITDDNGVQTIIRRFDTLNPVIPLQSPILLAVAAAVGNATSLESIEPDEKRESSVCGAVDSLDIFFDQENSLGIRENYSYLFDGQETVGTSDQETSLGVTKGLGNSCPRSETQDSKHKSTLCKPLISLGNNFGDFLSGNLSLEKDINDELQKNHDDEIVETQLSPINDTGSLLNWQEALNKLEPSSPRLVYKQLEAENTRIQAPRLPDSDLPQIEPEGESEKTTVNRSRLAAWRYRKFDTFSFSKTKLENQLEKKEKGVAITQQTLSGINIETGKVKKRPSLLFRLWNSMTPESVSGRDQTHPQGQSGNACVETDQGVFSRPLKIYHASDSSVKKGQGHIFNDTKEQNSRKGSKATAITEIKELTSHGIVKTTITESRIKKTKDDSLHNLQADNVVVNGIQNGDKFKDFIKEPEQRVGPGQTAVEDFLGPRKIRKRYPVLSPDVFPITYPKPPALGPAKRASVSWSKSAQEFAGPPGSVCHNGERLVSDAFRSGSSDFSKPGFTQAGIPTLGCLKNKVRFGEEPLFEESSLAADWDIAVRMMEEFSKADRKLKRAGAIKLKRSAEGIDPGKDGIGRSFTNESMVRSNGSLCTKTVRRVLEGDDEDDEDGNEYEDGSEDEDGNEDEDEDEDDDGDDDEDDDDDDDGDVESGMSEDSSEAESLEGLRYKTLVEENVV